MQLLVFLPDMALELPSDVGSSSASEESQVELPEEMQKTSGCCKKNCVAEVSKDAFKQSARTRLQWSLSELDLAGKNTLWFNQLLNMNRSHPQAANRTEFQWHGLTLCQTAYSMISGCPKKKIRSFLRAIAAGQVLAPRDARLCPFARPQPKRQDVDSFFVHVYEHLAEPLAIAKDQSSASTGENEEDDNGLPTFEHVAAPEWLLTNDSLRIAVELAQLSGGVGGLPVRDDRVSVEKRWIPTMSQAELFELYKDLHGQHEHVSSWSGFSRAWKCWQSVLGIRAPQVHSRCDDCARYSQFRRIQTSAADLEAVTKAYTSHIKQVYADRQILTSMENAVEHGMLTEGTELPHVVITIDAMDKSKYLIPRQLQNSKKLSTLWRPALRFVGCLVPGILEFHAIFEADSKGDSDMQQTVISRCLDLISEELAKRQKGMPRRVILNFDNTSKEGRNSMLLGYAAALVSSGRVEECTLAMYRVGHTHNRLDQRFGVIANKLSHAECLETPQDYVAYLQENYKAARNLPVHIELLSGVHSWRTLFEPCGFEFAGLQGSKTTADAAHVLRVVKRCLVQAAVPNVTCDLDQDEEGNPNDPVLLAKHWLCSRQLSQPPTVLFQNLPAIPWQNLRTMPAAPRTVLTAESRKQYEKTAEAVLELPWQLNAASAYLRNWLARNGQGNGVPPDLTFVVEGPSFLPGSVHEASTLPTWQDFAPEGAVAVLRKAKAKAVPKDKAKAKAQAGKKRPAPDTTHAAPQLAGVSRGQRARLSLAQAAGPAAAAAAMATAEGDQEESVAAADPEPDELAPGPAVPLQEPVPPAPVAEPAAVVEPAGPQLENPNQRATTFMWGLSRFTPKFKTDGSTTLAWQLTCAHPNHKNCNRARNVKACSSEEECFRMLKQWALLGRTCASKADHKELWQSVEGMLAAGTLPATEDLDARRMESPDDFAAAREDKQ